MLSASTWLIVDASENLNCKMSLEILSDPHVCLTGCVPEPFRMKWGNSTQSNMQSYLSSLPRQIVDVLWTFFHTFDQETCKEVTSKDRIMCVMGQCGFIEHNQLYFCWNPGIPLWAVHAGNLQDSAVLC